MLGVMQGTMLMHIAGKWMLADRELHVGDEIEVQIVGRWRRARFVYDRAEREHHLVLMDIGRPWPLADLDEARWPAGDGAGHEPGRAAQP
jgi:hypothetical protein